MDIPGELQPQVAKYVVRSKQMIRDYGDTMTEKETETWLVEPMLEILQWDTKNIDVRKGYPIKTEGSNYEADYALMINARPRMLIEVKRAANDLRDENVIQLMRYAFYEKADVFILTNGDEWRVYEPYDLKDMVFRFNLENMETNLDCLWLLSKNSIDTGLLDQEILRRYTIEKVYSYVNENRDHWISDIQGMSKKFTKESISRILDRMIVGKRTIEGKQVGPGKVVIPPDVRDPWITNGEKWHLVNRLGSRSIDELSDMAKHLLRINEIISSTVPDVTGPYWNQKYYVAFKSDGTMWSSISTGLKILDLHIRCSSSQFSIEDLATRLSVKVFDKGATFSEKLNFPSSIQEKSRNRILLKIKSDFNSENEEFERFLKEAYESFKMNVRIQGTESGEYTIEGKFTGQYAHLRPIFHVLESKVKEFGEDVKVNLRKIYIGFVRKHTFAVIYISKDKIDVGLSLDSSVEDDRLRDASNWGWSRINKGTSVSRVEDIDDQLIEWMKQSYDRS